MTKSEKEAEKEKEKEKEKDTEPGETPDKKDKKRRDVLYGKGGVSWWSFVNCFYSMF